MFNELICKTKDKLQIKSKTGTFEANGIYPQKATQKILVLEHGRNPSTDYYIRPRLPASEEVLTDIIDIAKQKIDDTNLVDGTFVVIVRYLNATWCQTLLAKKTKLAGVALFMDDDLPNAINDSSLPCRYRIKIKPRFHNQIDCISTLISELWVSCESLKQKYRHLNPKLLEPLPLQTDRIPEFNAPENDKISIIAMPASMQAVEQRMEQLPSKATQTRNQGIKTFLNLPLEINSGNDKSASIKQESLTYFYHGGLPHYNEAKWLKPIVEAVQARTDKLTFIIIGDDKVHSLYHGVPRVKTLNSMSWRTYRDTLPTYEHTIGLAPLLPSDHNKYRSYTKFFDITRLGAVGIYTDTLPYQQFIKNNVDGFLLPNDLERWVEKILDLINSPKERKKILRNAYERSQKLQQKGLQLHPLMKKPDTK